MSNPNQIVVGTKYRVVPTSRNLADPNTVRKDMKVTRAYAEQLNEEFEHGGLLKFEIDEEKTRAFHAGETLNLADLKALGYSVPPKGKTETDKPKNETAKPNKFIDGINAAESIEALRAFFDGIPNTQKHKEVKDAFETKLKTLTNEN